VKKPHGRGKAVHCAVRTGVIESLVSDPFLVSVKGKKIKACPALSFATKAVREADPVIDDLQDQMPPLPPAASISALENMHKLLLEALRHREQEIFRYLAILGPALGGFVWLLHSAKGEVNLFTVGTMGVLFLLFLGTIYSLALGFNYRYIVLELAKLEAVLQIRDAMLIGWPRFRQAFLDRYRLWRLPWCTPPEIIKIFWLAFLAGIIWVTVTALICGPALLIKWLVVLTGAVCFLVALLAPIWFGLKLKKHCLREPQSWDSGTSSRSGGNTMDNHKIEPHRITKPIQLMAVWFVTLLLIDSSLLAAAKFIKEPSWIPPFLVISAVALVPFFVGGVFLMQTVFRKELQEDPFYAQWLTMKVARGETTAQIAAAASENSRTKQRTLMEYMILNTLWTKQVNKFPDLSAFFTFTMGFPTRSQDQAFREAGAKLMGEGLVANDDNGHYLLTISGFDYCKKHFREFPKEQWWPEETINTDNLNKVIGTDT
jgi:hypothetical protein